MWVYLDGQWIDGREASISCHDAGVKHGVGLFETMRAWNGHVFEVDRHVDRLIHSAKELGLTDRLRRAPLAEAIQMTVRQNDLSEARVRLTVTGGNLSLLQTARSEGNPEHRPSVFIVASPPTGYPDALFDQGVGTTIAQAKANPFDPTTSHKTLNYWSRLRALTEAAAGHGSEALWLSVTNHAVGGSVSNLVVVKDGRVLTPLVRGEEPQGAIPSPALPGVTRRVVLEAAEAKGYPVDRKLLTVEDVLDADEVMLTNSSWLVLPVVRVEKKTLGGGQPGEVTRSLREAALHRVAEDCGGSPSDIRT